MGLKSWDISLNFIESKKPCHFKENRNWECKGTKKKKYFIQLKGLIKKSLVDQFLNS